MLIGLPCLNKVDLTLPYLTKWREIEESQVGEGEGRVYLGKNISRVGGGGELGVVTLSIFHGEIH